MHQIPVNGKVEDLANSAHDPQRPEPRPSACIRFGCALAFDAMLHLLMLQLFPVYLGHAKCDDTLPAVAVETQAALTVEYQICRQPRLLRALVFTLSTYLDNDKYNTAYIQAYRTCSECLAARRSVEVALNIHIYQARVVPPSLRALVRPSVDVHDTPILLMTTVLMSIWNYFECEKRLSAGPCDFDSRHGDLRAELFTVARPHYYTIQLWPFCFIVKGAKAAQQLRTIFILLEKLMCINAASKWDNSTLVMELSKPFKFSTLRTTQRLMARYYTTKDVALTTTYEHKMLNEKHGMYELRNGLLNTQENSSHTLGAHRVFAEISMGILTTARPTPADVFRTYEGSPVKIILIRTNYRANEGRMLSVRHYRGNTITAYLSAAFLVYIKEIEVRVCGFIVLSEFLALLPRTFPSSYRKNQLQSQKSRLPQDVIQYQAETFKNTTLMGLRYVANRVASVLGQPDQETTTAPESFQTIELLQSRFYLTQAVDIRKSTYHLATQNSYTVSTHYFTYTDHTASLIHKLSRQDSKIIEIRTTSNVDRRIAITIGKAVLILVAKCVKANRRGDPPKGPRVLAEGGQIERSYLGRERGRIP
ncbi:hypothetical protein BC629DRAFT_1443670 [Irpex lacteus]|nr:hypothetical protein BC629DRAFT_1443670 [Irpex lacteus]